MSLARAQSIIALDWVSFCNQNVKPKPKAPPPPPPPPPPPQSGPPDEGVVHPGAFCSPEGATGQTWGLPPIAGFTIRVEVTASNIDGDTVVDSEAYTINP